MARLTAMVVLGCLLVPALARDPDYVAEYVIQSKAEAQKKLATLKKKYQELTTRVDHGRLSPADRANLARQSREIHDQIAALRKKPPPVFLDASQLTVGAVGVLSGPNWKVIAVKGAMESVLVPRLPVYKAEWVPARKIGSNASSGNFYPLEKKAGEKDGPPLTVKGYPTKGLAVGELTTLPKDQPFAVTSPGVVEALDMEAIKKKYVK